MQPSERPTGRQPFHSLMMLEAVADYPPVLSDRLLTDPLAQAIRSVYTMLQSPHLSVLLYTSDRWRPISLHVPSWSCEYNPVLMQRRHAAAIQRPSPSWATWCGQNWRPRTSSGAWRPPRPGTRPAWAPSRAWRRLQSASRATLPQLGAALQLLPCTTSRAPDPVQAAADQHEMA